MTEKPLLDEIRLAASRHGARLFRNNVAKAWVGKIVMNNASQIMLQNYRPLHAGLCVGSSDLIGWTKEGKFLAVEIKTGNLKTTLAQDLFISAVQAAGGIGIVARCVEDVENLLRLEIMNPKRR